MMIFIMEKVLPILISMERSVFYLSRLLQGVICSKPANGLLSFPFTIRNQFVTTLSTLEGAKALRKEFLDCQRDFYKTALTEAAAHPVKAYVFGDNNDQAKTDIFVEMLQRHQIDVYQLNK